MLYRSGCVSYCQEPVSATEVASCSGVGCCKTPIPKRLKRLDVRLYSTNEHIDTWKYNPCGYAFLAAQDSLNISRTRLSDLPNTTIDSQVVLDWVIGVETCKAVVHRPHNYSCGHNTRCSDSTNGPGYRCLCKEGFQGNPYLSHGCQDIDECEEPMRFPCEGTCVNTPGNYTCRCPLGMHGDGKVGCKGFRVATLVAGTCLGIAFLLALGVLFSLHQGMKKKRQIKLKMNFFKKNGGLLLEQQISSDEGKLERSKIFTAEELDKATDNYNENRILGQGSQGTVYKGMLPDGRIVAVKKSGIMDEGQTQQFINEVVILSHVNHRHIVKLLGCCLETEVPLLVYEFISNGTLSNHIHHQMEEVLPIKWSDRLRIAKEVAGAVAYMHSTASVPIYHRDIKSSNILLDEKYRAKVSDFGSSRSVPTEKTHLTTVVQGTFGYLDPEYFQSHQFTEKSDVYSFGVVLVELLTGRKPISTVRSEEERGLAAQFISSIKEKRLVDVLDPQVVTGAEKEELVIVANLATRCLKLNGSKRPTMREVALELEYLTVSREHFPAEQNCQEGDYFIEVGGDASSTQTWTGRLENGNELELALLNNLSS